MAGAKTDPKHAPGKQTTVEEGTEFKGTLSSNCEVVVRGKVDGDLTAPSVIVSDTGAVVGNVKADCIRSEGVLAGCVDADDVYLSGSVRSDTIIRAKTLEVKLQSRRGKLEVTFGECILEVGDDPAAEASESKPESAQSKPPHARKSTRPSVRPPVAAEPTVASDDESKHNGAAESGEERGPERHSVPPPN